MIFADKLIKLRRQRGWSQEELAEKMGVTRQSVSKWESMQSLPDLDRILQLSKLFEVSTDYLLKDEIETEDTEIKEAGAENEERYVSLKEANEFVSAKKSSAMPIAAGVFLCIVSPICLLILLALSENPDIAITENMASGLGLIVLFLFVAAAVILFILNGHKTSKFEFMEKEIIKTDFSVAEKIRNEKESFSKEYIRSCAAGVIICILSVIPLFAGIIINADNDILSVCALAVTLFMVAVGVMILTRVNTINNSYNMILQEGDYSKDKKKHSPFVSAVIVSYWLTAVAVYLIWSFLSAKWDITWIVFAAAGVLFPAVLAVANLISKRKQ